MAVLTLADHQSSHFSPRSLPESNLLRLEKGIYLSSSSTKILSFSPSSTLPLIPKIRCCAKLFLHRSFQSQRSSFFPLARHRNKIKLIVPRRQTVLRHSPTRPATPCARPKH
ncbi:hypothetical protein AVEN_134156-1 [Araneus ventricosus]|uniref:Uncharacterized protein n=1 Tax=Araneus ventricosus TaxID=182803 RepID=A0A4Y2JHF5_ARAVE|nr:hypothetical protein AVEN_134156-1 [Araneus ventricosus]